MEQPLTAVGPSQRRRYEVLDGFRGVAAIGIMLFHSRHYFIAGHMAGRAYLAVNFFYLMSGFVIAHAYEHKLTHGLTFADFVKARLARLYPVYALGAALGLVVTLLVRHVLLPWMPLGEIAGVALLSVFFIPILVGPGHQNIFPLNAPYWSLFYEMVVNLGYAAIGARLSDKWLGRIVLASGVGLVLCWYTWGELSPGFSVGNWIGGAARAGFGFPLGVLLYRNHRAGKLARFRGADGALVLMLFALLLISPTGGMARGTAALVDLGVIFMILPMLAALAVEAQPTKTAFYRRLGRLSYPLFALHYPMLMLGFGLGAALDLPSAPVMTASCVGALTLAWLVARWLEPDPRKAVVALAARFRAGPRLVTG